MTIFLRIISRHAKPMPARLPRPPLSTALCLAGLLLAGIGHAAPGAPTGACGPVRYYAPEDNFNSAPLKAPHPLLGSLLKGAENGVAVEQRNLAISFETGYLVRPCLATAAYWYEKAAAGGDPVAARWLAQHSDREQRRHSGDCIEAQCAGGEASAANTRLVLDADPRGHFHTRLTINNTSTPGMIDTGATLVSLGADTALRLGLIPGKGRRGLSRIANGSTMAVEHVTVPSLYVGGIKLDYVTVSISPSGAPTLIGMSALKSLKVDVASNRMTLSK
jgi:clan AA aspartic protease (TIGR02281 family)